MKDGCNDPSAQENSRIKNKKIQKFKIASYERPLDLLVKFLIDTSSAFHRKPGSCSWG
jgi:hypothetical protein